jgi:hypothetical protein
MVYKLHKISRAIDCTQKIFTRHTSRTSMQTNFSTPKTLLSTIRKHPSSATKKPIQKLNNTQNLCPLDLCLERALISKEMHKAANIFISLYILRYGNHRLISDYGYSLQRKIHILDPTEEIEKNSLYKHVSRALIEENSYKIIRDTCVFSITPSFLKQPKNNQILSKATFNDYNLFLKGMKTIYTLLCTSKLQQAA